VDLAVVGIVFAVTFLAELPDKSLFASLVLGARYRPLPVWLGVAAAFALHVVIAVIAGGILTLLPHRVVQAIVAALFLAGAALLLLTSESEEAAEGVEEGMRRVPPSFRRVWLTSFGVVFVGEWGDITQLTTANYAARYADPLSVAVGAVAGLWLVSGLAVTVGQAVLSRVPVLIVRRASGLILLAFAALSAYAAATG
jgi:Ca2+/H+ antiporter, TMEM165/GDT1 family